jgi:hypothetical protein
MLCEIVTQPEKPQRKLCSCFFKARGQMHDFKTVRCRDLAVWLFSRHSLHFFAKLNTT